MGESKTWVLALLARKLGLHPEGLGSAKGNVADIEVLMNVPFVSVVDLIRLKQPGLATIGELLLLGMQWAINIIKVK